MTYLCELAAKYGTDKAGRYTPVYDLLLHDRRREIRRILEIGIGTPEAMKHVVDYVPGASLRMWRDYCPNALVYGADVSQDVLFSDKRIATFAVDQGNAAQLIKVADGLKFDLIVDDGSHKPHHQILGLETLLPLVAQGGLYIIEDVNDFGELQQGIRHPALCISYPAVDKHAARCMVFRG